jgi:hypothetical protein
VSYNNIHPDPIDHLSQHMITSWSTREVVFCMIRQTPLTTELTSKVCSALMVHVHQDQRTQSVSAFSPCSILLNIKGDPSNPLTSSPDDLRCHQYLSLPSWARRSYQEYWQYKKITTRVSPHIIFDFRLPLLHYSYAFCHSINIVSCPCIGIRLGSRS